jgi:integrase
MKESTRLEYVRLGAHFVKTVKESNSEYSHIPPSMYLQALKERAGTTTPAYWRRLKTAYAEWCFENDYVKQGKAIKALKNPLTENGAHKKKPLPDGAKKRRKANHISSADFKKIYGAADEATQAVMDAIDLSGCRPSEISTIECLGFESFRVQSSKKDEKNTRGLDRDIKFDENDVANITRLNSAVLTLKYHADKDGISVNDLVSRVQRRFDKLSVKTFPRRKLKICLYSLRHQFGSNLKSSGMSRKEIAYLMGHRSTKSVDRYGDVRKGSKSGVSVQPDIDSKELNSLVRENHNAPGAARVNEINRKLDNSGSGSFDY